MDIFKGLKLKKNFNSIPDKNSILLISVLHNEEMIIDFFIKHYLSIGVTHFIFIDNGSTDKSYSKINKYAKDLNIQIYYTQDSYKRNNFGAVWINRILKKFKNNWFLIVDMDEILVLKNNQKLADIRHKMIRNKKKIANLILIDFYPINKINYKNDISNLNPFDVNCYYDRFVRNESSPASFKYLKYLISKKDGFCAWGGFRQRIYKKDSVCLTKKSFFKYDFGNFYDISCGYHWIFENKKLIFKKLCKRIYKKIIFKIFGKKNILKIFGKKFFKKISITSKNLKYTDELYILCHFKYFKKNYENFISYRIERNQDWDNSSEYKSYKAFKGEFSSFYNSEESIKFSNINKLYSDTVELI